MAALLALPFATALPAGYATTTKFHDSVSRCASYRLGMNTQLIDATAQATAPQKSRWTLTGPDGSTELRLDIHPGIPPLAEVHGEIDISTAKVTLTQVKGSIPVPPRAP